MAGPAMREIGAEEVRAAVPMAAAVAAVQDALRAGLDPEADPARSVVPVERGHLLLMPAQSHEYVGVKVASVAPENPALGHPRIQGSYLLLDARTLTPLAVLDGVALTAIRTAAVSAAAADLLAVPDASRVVVFGTGPQAHSHLEALAAIRPVRQVTVVGRDQRRLKEFVGHYRPAAGLPFTVEAGGTEAIGGADVVVCCTTARTPLFDGAALPAHATVVAVGSHEPDAREVDDETVRRSTVVVEARSAALREAGDIIQAVRAGVSGDALVGMADLVCGRAAVDPSRPRLFKSVGMAWEDLVIAAAAYQA
ncbi:ornithine cyclodeaminase family protein [Streptomyces sp. RB6PN25]|uniref:Ornithine cyclodeaminase family protein n=1 Tax=Streptomyces humicola TaxID=2953240 RepID=A0ABT1PPM4_9ACTN|nr:ornithine cyclodeaminase family protein [Streptomyces humicola]MCQ4079638.1 ornithine cyclodeaminase family protein [Streptomyces humicola]